MRRRDDIDDEALDALRQGRTPEGRRDLEALASLFVDVRRVHHAEPVPPMSPELTELVASGAAGHEHAPTYGTADSSAWGRIGRVKLLIGGAVASLGLVGGLGAAGALPAPVQRAVASTADVVGLDFPRPTTPPPAGPNGSSEVPAPLPAASTATTCPPTSSTAPSSTAPSPGAGQTPEQPAPSSTAPSPGAGQTPEQPAPGAPGGGPCGPAPTPTSTSTTSRSGSTTTRADRSTTTGPSSTTAPATTSTTTPAGR